MDKLKKARRVKNRAFQRMTTELETLLTKKDELKPVEIEALRKSINGKYEEVRKIDSEIFEGMLENDESEEALTQEQNIAEETVSRFNFITSLATSVLKEDEKESTSGSKSSSSSGNSKKRRFKLPTLEFRKFSGELKEWVPFWAQFKKIDEDTDLDDCDKYQYLVQATAPGSRARRVIESFPPTSENYSKALEAIKERYGREEVLIEVYVRELISLIIANSLQGSKRNLAALYDQLEAYLRALETLKVSSDCAAMLYPMVESCLPETLIREWQRRQSFAVDKSEDETATSTTSSSQDKLKKLRRFIRSEVEGEELIHMAVAGFSIQNKPKPPRDNKEVATAADLYVDSSKPNSCVFCEGNHRAIDCRKNMTFDQKRLALAKKGHCFRCLKYGHLSKACGAKLKCGKCQKGHLTFMCYSQEKDKTQQTVDNALANITPMPQVVLQTLAIRLKSKNGTKERIVKAFLDTGSQRSYVLKETARALGYDKQRTEQLEHALFGGRKTAAIEHEVYRIHVSSLDGLYHCNFEVLGQPKICDYVEPPELRALISEQEHLFTGICQEIGNPVEILIGADLLSKLLTGRQKNFSNGLIGIETRLGWSLMGKIEKENTIACAVTTSCLAVSEPLTKLWDLDVLGIRDPSEQKLRQERIEDVRRFFSQTVQIQPDGRYIVRLPWRYDKPDLPNNHNLALKRTLAKHQRLKEQGLVFDYDQVFAGWEAEGIVEECEPPSETLVCHYLPHRPVVKVQSTTKIRPVFDASARSSPNAPSLNDCLETGENLIELVPNALLRFRLNEIGVSADIKQAFLQISIAEQDRDFLRFLRIDETDEIRHFRHARVVFGVCCSPFMLGFTINEHLEKVEVECLNGELPFSSKRVSELKKSFYVDNLVTSVGNVDEFHSLKEMATEIMSLAKFDLRGWMHTSLEPDGKSPLDETILGIKWDRRDDTLRICPDNLTETPLTKVTKRILLSVAQRIFDPIGYSCPVSLQPKKLLRDIWKLKMKWDEPLPPNLAERFEEWVKELVFVVDIRVPRWVNGSDGRLSLHIFVDACKEAYGTVIFLRNEQSEGTSVHLIAAKSRVAPLKELTIPRLELLAATVGSRLYDSIQDIFGKEVETFFWTDSSTVWTWIRRREPWSTFVRNRVEEIKRLTDSDRWFHVPGEMNPADLPSRGCGAKTLRESRWWEGPSWLRASPDTWPRSNPDADEEEVSSEKRKTVVACADVIKKRAEIDTAWTYRYFSRYPRIVRMIGWILRFAHNCRSVKRTAGELSAEEYSAAESRLLSTVQLQFLNDEQFNNLKVFQDNEGLVRIQTKLLRREDTPGFRSPIVLPCKDPVVLCLIRHYHLKNQHVGTQGLLALLRENFWILRGRRTVRSVIRSCVPCRRFQSKKVSAPLASLPEERVRDAAPFEVVGVDLAGPLYLRGATKAWICLFTCAVIRAVHLELVSGLSTSEFILAFRRFIARRGRPSIVFADNGTNFVGAANALAEIDWEEVKKFSSSKKIKWRFLPPAAPWWGGWWERLVGITKQLLKRTLGRTSLTSDEMITLLSETEAIINARPLTYVSEDPDDLTPLTPNLFLQGARDAGVPDLDQLDSTSLSRRARHLLNLKIALYRRFRSEYLALLVQNAKTRDTRYLCEGEIVLIGCDNARRLNWPLAKILELLPGKDGQVRVVKLRTASGELLRPVQRVYPLEVLPEERSLPVVGNNDRSVPIRGSSSTPLEVEHDAADDEDVALAADDDASLTEDSLFPSTVRTLRGRAVKPPKKLNL